MVSTAEQIVQILEQQYPGVVLSASESFGSKTLIIKASENIKVLDLLRGHAEWSFDYLVDITAVHYPEQAGQELAVVYHIQNMRRGDRLRLKAYIPIAQPDIESATGIYSGANWMERETYDFYGVNFLNHPNLIRILNVPEMDYFPLRKEYPLEDQTRKDKDDEMFGRNSLQK